MRAALVAALALALAGTTGAVALSKPGIRFVSLIPVVVKGTHFLPREPVRVTLHAGMDKRTRVTRTNASGAFLVRFGTLAPEERCSGKISLLAVGARGDRAWYRLPTLNCPTPAPASAHR